MSKRALIVLAAVALALLGYIVAFERGSVTSSEREGRAGRVLVDFVRDKVERLTVQRHGSEVVLTRNKLADGALAGFRVQAPYRAKADDDIVDHLLGELEWLSARRTLDGLSAADLASFGLDKPRYRLSFASGGATHGLSVGHADVHGEDVYVRVDDQPRAYVVPKSLLEVIDHEPAQYRDKQLFPELTVAWVHKLVITQAGKAHEFTQQDKRWWTDEQPKTYADGKVIDELLHALSELRATHYSEGKVEPALFAQPVLKLAAAIVPDETREDQKARLVVLELGGPCAGHAGERYVRSSIEGADAQVSCVGEAQLKALELSTLPLREPRLFASDVTSIERFVLTRGDGSLALPKARGDIKLSLARESTGWKAQSGVGAEQAGVVDTEAVSAWLSELAAARAVGYAPTASLVEQGSLLLELASSSERIVYGALDAHGEVWVKRGDEPLLVRFPGSVFDRLQPSAGRFAKLALWSGHQPSEVVALSVKSAPLARSLKLEQGSWRADDETQVDSERVRELVRSLLDLRAKSFLTREVRPAHGFTDERPNIELRLADGATLTLALGAATDRGGYALVQTRAAARTQPAEQSVVEVGSEALAILAELAGGPPTVASPVPPNEVEEEEEEEEPGHAHH